MLCVVEYRVSVLVKHRDRLAVSSDDETVRLVNASAKQLRKLHLLEQLKLEFCSNFGRQLKLVTLSVVHDNDYEVALADHAQNKWSVLDVALVDHHVVEYRHVVELVDLVDRRQQHALVEHDRVHVQLVDQQRFEFRLLEVETHDKRLVVRAERDVQFVADAVFEDVIFLFPDFEYAELPVFFGRSVSFDHVAVIF